MDEAWSSRVRRVLPEPGAVICTPTEAHALLEVAYLAMAIDQETNEAEADAFREISVRLRGLVDQDAAPPSEMDLATVLGTFRSRTPHGRETTRIRELSAILGGDRVRWIAYKIAFAMTLVDFDTSEEEVAIDKAFREALDIDDARADALQKEVFAALEG